MPGFCHHAVPHDQAVAVLGVALKTQEANRLSFRERDRLAEIEQSFRLVHMGEEDALEAFDASGARRLAPALWGAEPAQMPIADARLGEMAASWFLEKPFLRETGAARMSRTSSTPASLSTRMKASTVPPS